MLNHMILQRTPDDLIRVNVYRMWCENKNRTKEEWIPLLEAFAIVHQSTVDHIKIICDAYVNNDRATKLVITDNNIWNAIKNSYQKTYKPKEFMSFFNFETKVVESKGKTCRAMTDMHTHLLNISGHLYNLWIEHPHANKFDNYARIFNISANTINMKFALYEWAIPFAIIPNWHLHNPKVNYLQGLVHCPMTGDEPIIEDTPSTTWIDEFKELVNNGRANIEQIKNNNSELYNHITTYHRDNMIILHWKNKTKKCVWPLTGLNFLATQFIQQLASSQCVIKESTDIDALTFYIPNIHPDKQTFLWNPRRTPKIGSIFIKCPCIKENQECNGCFHLSDPKMLRAFKNIFNNVPQDATDNVKNLFTLIQTMLNVPLNTYRMLSICPACQCENISHEAQYNHTGANPKLKHPTDITCRHCNFNYCTDCKQSHPGHICRGFNQDEDPGKIFQACPGCKVATERISGCAFMHCSNKTCNRMWCWICRCFQYEEQGIDTDDSHNHYCMTENYYQFNPQWINNREFKPYTNESPPSPDDNEDWTPWYFH